MRRDPRVAALVCREEPGLCAEAYGLELAAGVAVWRVFRVHDGFTRELCRVLGWEEALDLCAEPVIGAQYPLAAAMAVEPPVADGSLDDEEARLLARLFELAPPPATAYVYAAGSYFVTWSALVSGVNGVDSASAGGAIASAISTVFVARVTDCGVVAEVVDVREEWVRYALAAPLAVSKWRHAVAKVAKMASSLPHVHLHNPGGQVLVVAPAEPPGSVPHAKNGFIEYHGRLTAEDARRRWEEAVNAARTLARALGVKY